MPIDYAAEKAAAEARKRAVWAEAEREFTAWYQDVGTRAELHTNGHAGAQRGVALETLPKCFCGKATKALGMCITHYVHWWRTLRGQINGRRNQRALCHPERAHWAKGLCRRCYSRLPETIRARTIRTAKRRYLEGPPAREPRCDPRRDRRPAPRRAWACEHTDEHAKARGLCARCYDRAMYAKRTRGTPLPPRFRRRRHCSRHPGRRQYARGLCRPCYDSWIRRNRRAAKRRAAGLAVRWVRPTGLPLVCGHNGRPRLARDMCSACYQRWRRDQRPARARHRAFRLPILCGHPTRKHHAKSCCQSCWRRGIWKRPGFLDGVFTNAPAPRKRRAFRGVRRTIECGHPERRYVALGRCGPCYWQYRRDRKQNGAKQEQLAKHLARQLAA